MNYLIEWITNIIIFILLATVIEMLLPSNQMKKYTKMVIGLLLISIILTPLFKLLSQDFEQMLKEIPVYNEGMDEKVKNSIEEKKIEIQASQDAYILEQMAVQLKEQANEELIDQKNVEIESISLSVENLDNFPDGLTSIMVSIKEYTEDESVPIVEPVVVSTSPNEEEPKDWSEISSLLSTIWEINEESIVIVGEGGIDKENEI
ncbi:hypothetical protein Q73_09105 [Bacillus coahuilensis m2-6]|uniref:Stage III sporulation protein AF n=1 Tax=Bacillus coahuilensis p1.1.43 TaxID=1150625 RepID=A0A147K7T6_9BACI|nr:stage III sporulation protein AF [Bacillus coahuilensis]KUP06180.1 hypothetical protein Q75_09610 [Bacillus coahuilensis p1.1.43]KUP07370.1 hypothetical protein Q73_09105 [Bacillus coahuilensis m2-6]